MDTLQQVPLSQLHLGFAERRERVNRQLIYEKQTRMAQVYISDTSDDDGGHAVVQAIQAT